jgi:hypothetical protein
LNWRDVVRVILGTFTLAILVWLLVGCAATKWTHPTANDQQFRTDDSECEKLAAASVGYPVSGVGYPASAGAQLSHAGLYKSMRMNQAYERCMMGKWWMKK